MNFFTMDPNLKYIYIYIFFWGGGGRGLEYVIVFTRNPNSKKKFFFGGVGGWGWLGGGVDGRTDEQAQTNLPLQLRRRWGHNNE